MTQTEPRIRRDGRCAVCRSPLNSTPRPGVPPLLYVDPFCSSKCAKAYYDVEILSLEKKSEGAAPK